MAVLHNQVLRPGNFSVLFSQWSRFPDAVPFAGGTALIRSRRGELRYPSKYVPHTPILPGNILSLEGIEDLRRITRTEHYLEIGAMVRLNEIIGLGKTVPDVFTGTLKGIAGPPVRNLATIGGNICIAGDAAAPLAALDARYELRSAGSSRWISAYRFSSEETGPARGELLTRIRIPLEHWNYTVYRKFLPGDSGGEGGVLILLAKNQKDVLTHIQVVFSGGKAQAGAAGVRGEHLFRSKDSENTLEGKALPLSRKDALQHGEMWRSYLSGLGKPGPLLRTKIVNVIESAMLSLAD